MRLLKLVGALSGLPAIVVFSFAAILWAAPGHPAGLSWWQLALCGPAVGALLGWAIIALTRGVTQHVQLLSLLLGAMAILAGASAMLDLSPLLAGAAAGVVVMNRAVLPHRILLAAHSLEMPLVIALLVLVGASWSGLSLAWPVVVVLVAIRLPAALLAGSVIQRVANRHQVGLQVPWLGLGLLPQGEIALVLLVALARWISPASGLFEAAVIALIINQVAGRTWLERRLFPAPSSSGAKQPSEPRAPNGGSG
jgi:hypothetical protein